MTAVALVTVGGYAQTGAAKPAAPPRKEVALPPVVPNLKWTIKQNVAQLLLNPDIQRDMAIGDDTKKALMRVYGDYQDRYTALLAGKAEGNEELADKLDAAMLDAANKAIALLDTPESTRLNQIGIRVIGFDSVRMPEVRHTLMLTADQTAALDKLLAAIDEKQQALDSALGDRLSKLHDPGPNATADEATAFRKAQKDVFAEFDGQGKEIDVLKHSSWATFYGGLSDEQKKAWRIARGKPVYEK